LGPVSDFRRFIERFSQSISRQPTLQNPRLASIPRPGLAAQSRNDAVGPWQFVARTQSCGQ
jgi:hypothetical protein